MNPRHWVIPGYLLACLLAGGASAEGYGANAILQFGALAIIAWALLSPTPLPKERPGRQLYLLVAMVLAIFVVQLVPLPPAIWSALPGRGDVAEGYRLLGMPLPWMPLSLDPINTLSDFFWILPGIAIVAGIVTLRAFTNKLLIGAVAAAALANVCLGAVQVVGGMTSPFYLYEITNYGQPVGFFSNSNHTATLLVATIPLLAALLAGEMVRSSSMRRAAGLVVIAVAALGMTVVGLIINFSLAALGLSVPVIGASFLLFHFRTGRIPVLGGLLVAALGVAAVLALIMGPFGNNLTDAAASTSQQSRATSFSKTLEAAGDFAPVGSGLGTFRPVYRQYEDPAQITSTYMNHAHSDLLELLLETGVPGMLVLLLFLAWWTRRTMAAWRNPEPDLIVRAATIASGAIMLHSLVDYPLRTAAILAVFAMSCALLTDPRPMRRSSGRKVSQARHLTS